MGRTCSYLTICLAAVLAALSAASAAAADPTVDSAVYLLRQAVEGRGGASRAGGDDASARLRALRHLRDPAAAPLFEHLAQASHPVLQVHGILGLAELNPPGAGLDLARVAQIEQAPVQAELITAAMDDDLLPNAQARQMMAWPGLDLSVKVLIATRLLEAGEFDDRPLLHEALQSDIDGLRGIAALLLHQLGDAEGTRVLQSLNTSNRSQRDVVRAMLLQTAVRHGFSRCGDWAYAVAVEPDIDPTLSLLALQTALRFSEPRAEALWREKLQRTDDPAARMRLALLALRMSPWIEPTMFDPLTQMDDPLLRQIGATGHAVAAASPTLTEQVIRLLLMHHPRTTAWALDYAREKARPEDAQLILLGIIRAYGEGPAHDQMQRLDDVVHAARLLYDQHPVIGTRLLRPILSDPGSDDLLVQAILLGLVRCRDDAQPVIDGLPPFQDLSAKALSLLLLARSDKGMSETQIRDLALLVRGGGRLEDSLRIQAAWGYLKRTDQLRIALNRVLSP